MKKANAAERYRKKLQEAQDLEKKNEDLRTELSEVRQQFSVADEARQQATGLQLALEEYKRILPKIEQDRHELQMMKTQLEFDNQTLAQRCKLAKDQHANDQESIANLSNKLADLELSNGANAISCEGLDSEIRHGTRREVELQVLLPLLRWTRLTGLGRKAKVVQLENENQQLQSANALQASQNTALQQLLEDTRESHEQRDMKSLQIYQEKLKLESSLAAIKEDDLTQGYAIKSIVNNKDTHEITSTEAFKKMRDQLKAEQKKSARLEADLSALKAQLKGTGSDRPLPEEENTAQQKPESSEPALKEILQRLKNATDGVMQGEEERNAALDHQISSLANHIVDSRERLAKRAQVQEAVFSSQPGRREAAPPKSSRVSRLLPNFRKPEEQQKGNGAGSSNANEEEVITRVSSSELFRAIIPSPHAG